MQFVPWIQQSIRPLSEPDMIIVVVMYPPICRPLPARGGGGRKFNFECASVHEIYPIDLEGDTSCHFKPGKVPLVTRTTLWPCKWPDCQKILPRFHHRGVAWQRLILGWPEMSLLHLAPQACATSLLTLK